MSGIIKETDIRDPDVHNQYLELVKKDSERIFKDKKLFKKIICPACEGIQHIYEFEKIGFSYVSCSDCETLFVNPRPPFDKFIQLYEDSPSTRFWINKFFLPKIEARRLKIFKPRAQFVAERLGEFRKAKIGDIGAGFGLFSDELVNLWPDADIFAIEPSSEMAQICREKGLKVIQAVFENINPDQHKFDMLTVFELLEHLHEPPSFLKKAFHLLNSEGILLITTLNGLGFDIQIQWENSKSVFPPHHLNFFNPHSMQILLERIGFTVVDIETSGELDWDIVESRYKDEGIYPGRFFSTVSKFGSIKAKDDFQLWLRQHRFSSHMRIIAKKEAPCLKKS